MDDAAALPLAYVLRPAGGRTSSPCSCGAPGASPRSGPTRSCATQAFMAQTNLLARMSAEFARRSCTPSSSSRCARCCLRASTSKSTSRRATARGSSASPSSPTGTLFATLRRGHGVGRHRHHRHLHRARDQGQQLRRGDPACAIDIVVSATGFSMSLFGGVAFSVDDEPVDFTERVTYRGIMISGDAEHGLHLRLLRGTAAGRCGWTWSSTCSSACPRPANMCWP